MKKWSMFLVFSLMLALMVPSFAHARYDFGSFDFQGQTVSFVGWHNFLDRFEEGKVLEGRIQEAEKLFNVKLESVVLGWDEYVEGLMTRLLSGDSEHDVWLLSHDFFWQMVARDPFFAVSDILPAAYYETLSSSHNQTYQVMSFRGNRFGFSSFGNILGTMRFMGFNRDMLDRLGLPDIYELYLAGEWTWEKATELMLAATQDTTGDGEIDQWGLSTPWASGFVLTNDGRSVTTDANGRLQFAMADEKVAAAITQIYEWNLVHRVVLGGDWGGDQFAAGKVLMQPLETWRFDFVGPKMEDRFGIVPKPKGPHAAGYSYPQLQLESLMLPINSKNPLAMVALADFLFQAEDVYEELEESFARIAPDRIAYQVLKDGVNNWRGEMHPLFGVIGATLNASYGEALRGEKSPMVAMSEVQEAIQAILDDMFNN